MRQFPISKPALPVSFAFLPRCCFVIEQRFLLFLHFKNAAHRRLIPAQIVEQQFDAISQSERLDRQRTARGGFIPVRLRFPRDLRQLFRPLPVPFSLPRGGLSLTVALRCWTRTAATVLLGEP